MPECDVLQQADIVTEDFWIESCNAKTKVIKTANQNKKEISQNNENTKQKRANCMKRKKTRVTKSRLKVVLHLID